MSKTTTVVTVLAAGVALGLAGGSWLMSLPAGPRRRRHPPRSAPCPTPLGPRIFPAPTMWSRAGRRIWLRYRGMISGPMDRRAAFSPRARTACSCSAAPSCRPCGARRRRCIQRSDRACSSLLPACRGAMPTRRRRRAPAGRARIRRREWSCGGAQRRLTVRWASMRAAITASPWSTRRATTSRIGRNGTTCSSARMPSTSAL